jgi:hypothetical protein
MKYAVEMNSDAMIYVPSFIKTGSAIQKLIGEHTDTHREHSDLISLLLYKKMEYRLIGGIHTHTDNMGIA